MKKISAISFFLLLMSFCSLGQDLSVENIHVIENFIHHVKTGDIKALADLTAYPLKREYPIPNIYDKREFIARYKEVFNDSLVRLIIKSRPTNDWSEMGWRGIMLLNGAVWLDLDGKLIAVNTQSPFERKRRTELISEDKKHLHESIKNYIRPICIIETNKYRIRIDEISDGKYRYVSWLLKNKMSGKPDVVLENGEIVFDGNGGNCHFEFKKDEYKYVCDIIEMGEDTAPPADLVIYKNNKEILFQRANKLIN